MSKTQLPESLQQFVARQKTKSVADLRDADEKTPSSPYGSYWYRAIACILLSGRVQSKFDGPPNMTDVKRIGKEANFNQYLTERVGTFLVALRAIDFDRQNRYSAGPNFAAFWNHDAAHLPAITRQAVARLFGSLTNHPLRYTEAPEDWCLIELLSLFFTCFHGRALVESEVGRTFQEFVELPEDDLIKAAHGLEIARNRVDVALWKKRLDARGQKALVGALYTAEWAYYADSKTTTTTKKATTTKAGWWYPSPTGLAMLGLGPAPAAPKLSKEFKVQTDGSVFAGTGLDWETLVPLFRYSKIQRIKEVCEFRLDRKKLAASPATSDPGKELRAVFRALEPLPPDVARLLGTKSRLGGKLGIRWCSALVKPENAEVLAAIRAHPKLKGYLEAGAPAGYLLIKTQSDPDNFVLRCRDLGFEVEWLGD